MKSPLKEPIDIPCAKYFALKEYTLGKIRSSQSKIAKLTSKVSLSETSKNNTAEMDQQEFYKIELSDIHSKGEGERRGNGEGSREKGTMFNVFKEIRIQV